jgi:DNA polymerase (family 10)
MVKQMESELLGIRGVREAVAAGSFRRMKETVGDIDFVVASDEPNVVIEHFVNMPQVYEVLRKGPSKAFVQLNNGMDADLLVVPRESFGAALQYFTGSKEHGVAIRKIALAKGLHLNEWGVYDTYKKRIGGSTENEVYELLDLDWIAPEMREDRGEVQVAKEKRGKLPRLIEYNDLRGDLQVHSSSTDGTMSIQDMASFAKERFGLEYVAITDHTKSLKLTNGLNEVQLLEQASKISEINDKLEQIEYSNGVNGNNSSSNNDNGYSTTGITTKKNFKRFKILSSAEVNIMKDGSLDIRDNVLDKLDIVGAAIHSSFSQPIDVQTKRLTEAAKNPNVDILFHPTGRRINKREGYPIDIQKIVETARDTNTVLEIDAHYDRLDLKDEYIRVAVQNKVKLIIDSDAHNPMHFAFLTFGIGQARRGWAEKSDIINTLPVQEMLKNLK